MKGVAVGRPVVGDGLNAGGSGVCVATLLCSPGVIVWIPALDAVAVGLPALVTVACDPGAG